MIFKNIIIIFYKIWTEVNLNVNNDPSIIHYFLRIIITYLRYRVTKI